MMKDHEQQQSEQHHPFPPSQLASQSKPVPHNEPNLSDSKEHEQDPGRFGYRNIVEKGVWRSPGEMQSSEREQLHGAEHTEQQERRSGQHMTEQQERQKLEHAESKQEQQMQTAPIEPIPTSLDEILLRLEDEIGYKTSFDVAVREMTIGNTRIAMLSLGGLVNSDIMLEVLKRLTFLQANQIGADAMESFFKYYIPSAQVRKEEDWNLILAAVLGGECALFVDGEPVSLAIEVRNFPARGPEEPSLEKVVRGSRDGFIETLMVNVSLVRRRLKDPKLRYELLRVGARTKTDVCIAYIDDIVDKQLLQEVKRKIEMIKIDGLPLADKQLEEATIKRGWNPFPLVRYSERPDTVSSHLLEGAIAIFVDTSPSVMTLPATYTDLMQHAEENRQTPLVGSYLRWVRFIGILSSLFLLPLWLLFVQHPEYRPEFLSFLGPKEAGAIPLVLQFFIAEIGIDLMRMASVHTPTSLATAMSLVAAILIGDIAVQTGVFVNEVILYMAVAAVGMFATPSYELGLANRLVRLLLILTVALFGLAGLTIPLTLIVIGLAMGRSVNRPYLWPLIPFDLKSTINILIRKPVLYNRTRPNIMKPQQSDRMPIDNGDNGDSH